MASGSVPKQDRQQDDAALARRIMAGEHAAFETLVRRHSAAAFRLAWRLLGSREEAEDLVQTLFVRYWHKPQAWNPEDGSRFSTWLYRVVMNAATDVLRKRRPSEPVERHAASLRDARVDLFQHLAGMQQRQRVQRAILALPERQRQAIALVYYEQLPMKQAAEVMQTTPKAVESLLGRARAALKADLSLNELIEEAS
ncbi:MAG: sigma-70 family RNA polymerase sigma factor [Gammaproteobacteria bacterium]|jgi:RNA polymerase sigma-70 factor, ECF subfamily